MVEYLYVFAIAFGIMLSCYCYLFVWFKHTNKELKNYDVIGILFIPVAVFLIVAGFGTVVVILRHLLN